jgi:hypothetical protein
LRILDTRLHADPSRVVLRPFHLGWQGAHTRSNRAIRLVADVAALSENRVREEYRKVLNDFKERHWQTEAMFKDRYDELAATLGLGDRDFSPMRLPRVRSFSNGCSAARGVPTGPGSRPCSATTTREFPRR